MADNPEITLLTLAEVRLRVGLSKTSIYKAMARGTFPRCVHVAPQAVRWRSDEIDSWIEEVSARRDPLPFQPQPAA